MSEYLNHLNTCKTCGRFLRACTCPPEAGVVKHSLGAVWGQILDFRDEAARQIEQCVRGAMISHFGEVSDEDVRKGGLIKSYPDRDEYYYRGEHFITVYRPAPVWNSHGTKLSLEYRVEYLPVRG